MDKTDIKILNLLQTNGKLNNQELADKIALSPSPCLRRVKILEDEGYISKYVAIIDADKVNLKLTILVTVGLSSHNSKLMGKFEAAIKAIPEVVQCYLIAGQSHDYMLKVIVPSLDEYHQFLLQKLTQIDGVLNVHSSFVLDKVIDKTALPIAGFR